MIIINSLSANYFTLNGTQYAKIYQPIKQGLNKVGIYNVYDTNQTILHSTHYSEFEIDTVTYASQDDVVSALLPAIYKPFNTGDFSSTQWGDIIGTITNQADLIALFNTKADINSLGVVAFNNDYNSLSNLPVLSGITVMEGYNETGTRSGGDLIVTIGDFDDSDTGLKAELNTAEGSFKVGDTNDVDTGGFYNFYSDLNGLAFQRNSDTLVSYNTNRIIGYSNDGSGFSNTLHYYSGATISQDSDIYLPSKSGMIALTSDLTGYTTSTPSLQEVTDVSASTTNAITIGNGVIGRINFNDGLVNSLLASTLGGMAIQNSAGIGFSTDRLTKDGVDVSLFSTVKYNATTNQPTLADSDTGKTGTQYFVSEGGTQDYGDGDITFNVGDIVANDGNKWFKKVDNNQTSGGQTNNITITAGSGTGNTYTVLDNDYQILGSIGSGMTFNLPSAGSSTNRVLKFTCNQIKFDDDVKESTSVSGITTVSAGTTFNTHVTLHCDGTSWYKTQ